MPNPQAKDVRRALSELGPPGQAQGWKYELLEVIRRQLVEARGEVPDWWEELRRQVEAGEL